MDKRTIIKRLVDHIAADLAVQTQAARAAHDAATHTESKAEDQYDTRGLEASYLAGAQSKRAMDLQETLDLYRYVDVKDFDGKTPISSTALVELESDEKRYYYLLMPKGGGFSISHEGKTIHVVTPQSPLGEALIGRRVGEQITVEIQRVARDYDITSAW